MFVAHLPAGYILSKYFASKCSVSEGSKKLLLYCGVVGSILPDFDLLYFYLVDDRQHTHHSYWTHIPIFWFSALFLSICCMTIFKSSRVLRNILILLLNIVLHLTLDTVAGGIRWLYPFTDNDYVLFEVQAKYGWWVLNFILHWTFVLEVSIVGFFFWYFSVVKSKT
jgi:LexA-binding, inner membrane-associated putative hydrolase